MPAQPPRPGPKGDLRALTSSVENVERQDRHRTELLVEECSQIEDDLEALRGRYEMFFLGIERREPTRERDEMKRRIGRIKSEFTSNTGLQFRIQTLNARYLAYERMWLRTAHEKEAGTYRRDLLRARRHQKQQVDRTATSVEPGGETLPGRPAAADGAVKGGAAGEKPTPAVAPPVPQAAFPGPRTAELVPAPASPQLPPGIAEAQVRALYEAYREAKRRCNEDVSRLSYELVARSVARQVPELVAKYKARTVEFKVVIKDGRAVLKAVPKP